MTARDRFLAGVLSLALVALAALSLAPTLQVAEGGAEPSPTTLPSRAYVEGVLGRAMNASPFGARSAADRALVALLFRGLVKLGPGTSIVPDLASRWETSEDGRSWTFHLRPGQRWGDGEPVTADDVAFTVAVLGSSEYSGPGAASWADVTATVVDPLTVRLELSAPLGDFLEAATQPVAPVHMLGETAIADLPDDVFGQHPIGSGPYRLVSLDPERALLAPSQADEVGGGVPGGPNFATPRATDSLATARPTIRPDVATPAITTIEFRFFDGVEALQQAWTGGQLDAVSGLPPGSVSPFAGQAGARVVRYPGTTLLGAVLNLRASHREFQEPTVRKALLAAIDRDAIVSTALAGYATRADSLVPPSSPVFDPEAATTTGHDPAAARKALAAAGWKESSGSWTPKDAKDPLVIELLSPEESANPTAYGVAEAITDAWHGIGLAVRHLPLPASELLAERVGKGDFQVAVLPLAIGLNPDLYPLLAASQTRTGGSNVSGLQDPALDQLLVAARTPTEEEARLKAYRDLEARLASLTYLLPIAFRDDVVVASSTVSNIVPRPVSGPGDRFWDVLTWRLADGR